MTISGAQLAACHSLPAVNRQGKDTLPRPDRLACISHGYIVISLQKITQSSTNLDRNSRIVAKPGLVNEALVMSIVIC
jgi:hypothetical protein